MKLKTIAGLFVVLINCSGNQQALRSELLVNRVSNHNQSKTWLTIENGPNQGLNYTDTLGNTYSYRYIATTLRNDTTIPIYLQMVLSAEYNFPSEFGDQKFKVFLLPKELTPDKVTFDSLTYELGDNALRDFFESYPNSPYILKEALQPNEECMVTLGTLYPRPSNCGVVPKALFLKDDEGLYGTCDSHINQNISTNSSLVLGLKVDFCRSCTVVPCGFISFVIPNVN